MDPIKGVVKRRRWSYKIEKKKGYLLIVLRTTEEYKEFIFFPSGAVRIEI
jgi:hypothetical protein